MEDSQSFIFLRKQAFIFGGLFLLANKLQVAGDQYLESAGLTAKQWFLIVAVEQFHDTPPTLSEVAELIGSSRQNVKQLASKLAKKDFLRIVKDEQDTRALRLILTEKCRLFWQKREDPDNQFIADIFGCLTGEETDVMSGCLPKICKRLDEMIIH